MAKRKRVKPLVPPGKAPAQAAAPVTSLKLARKLTTKFHGLLTEQAALLRGEKVVASAPAPAPRGPGGAPSTSAPAAGAPSTPAALSPAAASTRLREIELHMAAIGGRAAYQEASALSTKHFRSSRYVFKMLVRLGMQPAKGQAPLRVLELGAVNAQLAVCPWMRTRSIDLQSRDAHVEQIDFFDVPVADASPEGASGEYDVVVNAMVVNCVPDAVRRAEMLLRCRDHLRPGGIFVFAVPSRCIDMSRYVTRPLFEGYLAALGFTPVDVKRTPKISFYTMRRDDVVAGAAGAPVVAAAPVAAAAAAAAAGNAAPALAGVKRKRDAEGGVVVGGAGGGGAPAAWRPVVRVRSAGHTTVLARLAPPVVELPKAELPVTGFTLTDFALAVPREWVVRAPETPASAASLAAWADAAPVVAGKPPHKKARVAGAGGVAPVSAGGGGGGHGRSVEHGGKGAGAAAHVAAAAAGKTAVAVGAPSGKQQGGGAGGAGGAGGKHAQHAAGKHGAGGKHGKHAGKKPGAGGKAVKPTAAPAVVVVAAGGPARPVAAAPPARPQLAAAKPAAAKPVSAAVPSGGGSGAAPSAPSGVRKFVEMARPRPAYWGAAK